MVLIINSFTGVMYLSIFTTKATPHLTPFHPVIHSKNLMHLSYSVMTDDTFRFLHFEVQYPLLPLN